MQAIDKPMAVSADNVVPSSSLAAPAKATSQPASNNGPPKIPQLKLELLGKGNSAKANDQKTSPLPMLKEEEEEEEEGWMTFRTVDSDDCPTRETCTSSLTSGPCQNSCQSSGSMTYHASWQQRGGSSKMEETPRGKKIEETLGYSYSLTKHARQDFDNCSNWRLSSAPSACVPSSAKPASQIRNPPPYGGHGSYTQTATSKYTPLGYTGSASLTKDRGICNHYPGTGSMLSARALGRDNHLTRPEEFKFHSTNNKYSKDWRLSKPLIPDAKESLLALPGPLGCTVDAPTRDTRDEHGTFSQNETTWRL